MKKNYVSPVIVFDSFEIAENIASCSIISSPQGKYECPVTDEETGLTIFSDKLNGCIDTSMSNGNICYDVPVEGWNVFIS